MSKITKTIALILCIVMCFSACNGNPQNGESTTVAQDGTDTTQDSFTITDGKVVLPYNKTDGLNPFMAESYENIYLGYFLYEPLFSIDKSYTVTNAIADSVTVNDNAAVVKIRHNVTFSDFSTLTASDVVYSFNRAKNSYFWGNVLNNVVSATAQDDYTVEFSLGFKDTYVSGKLIFPIVKMVVTKLC